MSEALERVIAQQQKEIDQLRLAAARNTESWHRQNAAVDRVAHAAFVAINHPEDFEIRNQLRHSLVALGFCPRCEARPCHCDD